MSSKLLRRSIQDCSAVVTLEMTQMRSKPQDRQALAKHDMVCSVLTISCQHATAHEGRHIPSHLVTPELPGGNFSVAS